MSKMIPVEGHKNLYRDDNTNAILNKDKIGYENYIRMRNKNKDREIEMKSMKEEIKELKSMLNDLASKITS
mgnify:FL=1|tara:strand:- start:22 stop:234 length:213 start_codon:yes stop_codon:yes gene_type:complete